MENFWLSQDLWWEGYLWRGSLLPLGREAAPCIFSEIPRSRDWRLLRSRAGV